MTLWAKNVAPAVPELLSGYKRGNPATYLVNNQLFERLPLFFLGHRLTANRLVINLLHRMARAGLGGIRGGSRVLRRDEGVN